MQIVLDTEARKDYVRYRLVTCLDTETREKAEKLFCDYRRRGVITGNYLDNVWLVTDELSDMWNYQKNENDFALLFNDEAPEPSCALKKPSNWEVSRKGTNTMMGRKIAFQPFFRDFPRGGMSSFRIGSTL